MAKKSGNFIMLGCIFIITILILVSVTSIINHGQSESEDSPELDANVISRGDTSIFTLNKFATGSTRVTLLGTQEGRTTYLSIPPDANITFASMTVQGRMPEVLNKNNVGGRLSAIYGADFNSDDNLDILVTDKENHTVRILLNNGDKQLQFKHEYLTGDLPISAAIYDFNKDSHVDIAVANEGANSITVYQNSGTGDGSFKNKKEYKIGDIPHDITSGDFNGDGWLDLAAVTSNDDKLWVNLNKKNSTVTFAASLNYSTDDTPVGLASGDLNNDGLDDIAVIHVGANLSVNNLRYYDSVSVFINQGNAVFTLRDDYMVGKKPAEVIIKDFNNDGLLDLATANRAGYNISILLNHGEGKFSNSINYSIISAPLSGNKLDAGDIDGDGDLDIVSFCSKYNTLEVLLNRGDGTFQHYIEYPASLMPSDIFLGDFDNDGDLDVAACSEKNGDIGIIPNNGDGTFTTFEFFYTGTYPRGLISGDINGDGSPDLVSANYLSGTLTICYNDGKGNFDSVLDKEIAVEPFAITIGDFNNDSYLDLASADEALYKIVLAFNDGDGKFTQPKVEYDVGGYPYSIIYHDLNGDGEYDLISGNNAQLSISILLSKGNGTFGNYVDYSFSHNYPFGLAAGDMDDDGDEDIISANYGTHSKVDKVGKNISIIWNDGNGTFSSHTDYDVGLMPISVRTSDLDLDDDLDIVVTNTASNSTTVLFNQGNRTFGARKDYSVGARPMCVQLADLDKNGYLDIITANQNSDSISILYNKGDGTFTQQEEYLIGAQPVYVTLVDLNNDELLDIATCNLLSNSISVRLDIHYPENIALDIGETGTTDFTLKGSVSKQVRLADFSEQLNQYLAAHQSEIETTPMGPAVLVPVKISSTRMGTIELIELDIKYETGPDYDNDQIPDVWEIEHGLDITDPEDALVDLDNDGLTNLQEYHNGTDPMQGDSDNDGLNDGEEVETYFTDPLNKDTDNDGYNDFKEIDEGTDPLDEDDYPDKGEDGVCFTPGFGTELFVLALMMVIIPLCLNNRKRLRH